MPVCAQKATPRLERHKNLLNLAYFIGIGKIFYFDRLPTPCLMLGYSLRRKEGSNQA